MSGPTRHLFAGSRPGTGFRSSVNKPIELFSMLQFGGTGEDAVYDIKVLSDGDFVVMGRTKSTTFCGVDISAYTDGSSYYAWYIIKIDGSLPAVGWYKGGYFLSGNGYTLGLTAGDYPQIELDSSENILYAYGASAGGAGWKIYAINPSTMTLSMTADTAISVNCVAPEALVRFKHYGGTTYVCYANGMSMYGQTLNSSLVQTASATIVTSKSPKHMVVNSSYIYVLTYDLIVYRMDHTWRSATANDVSSFYIVAACEVLACNETDCYVAGISAVDSRSLLVKHPFGTAALWIDYTKTPSAGKTIRYRGLGFCDGRLFAMGFTNDGAVGTYDVGMLEINPLTGAGISDNWITYRGAQIGQSGKIFFTYKQPRWLGAGRYIVGGATDGNMPECEHIGGYDGYLIVINDSGEATE